MRLADLDARFVVATDTGWRDVDAFADAQGVLFDCPKCLGHKIMAWWPNAPSQLAGDPSGGKRWNASGTSLDDLTLSPSILLTSPEGCGWHGFVRDGKILDC